MMLLHKEMNCLEFLEELNNKVKFYEDRLEQHCKDYAPFSSEDPTSQAGAILKVLEWKVEDTLGIVHTLRHLRSISEKVHALGMADKLDYEHLVRLRNCTYLAVVRETQGLARHNSTSSMLNLSESVAAEKFSEVVEMIFHFSSEETNWTDR